MRLDPTRRQFLGLIAAAAGAAACRSRDRVVGNTSAPVNAMLEGLLARNRRRHPEYGGGLSNHMSMALVALAELGASADRLAEFEQRHSRKLEPFPADGDAVTSEDWRGAIGKLRALPGLVQVFSSDVRRLGRDTVLRQALPSLVSGLSGAAFHCMIRTAYAVRAGDDDEVAHALAYWAARATPLAPLDAQSGTERDPRVLLERARTGSAFAHQRFSEGLIAGRLRQAAASPGFGSIVSSLEVEGDTLGRLALAMLDLYATTGDFTALHAVTSTHAFRVLQPFMADREMALRFHWQALAAAYVAIGTPDIGTIRSGAFHEWDEINARAVASEDEHTIKLVDTCREEERAHGGGAYRVVASRRAGLA